MTRIQLADHDWLMTHYVEVEVLHYGPHLAPEVQIYEINEPADADRDDTCTPQIISMCAEDARRLARALWAGADEAERVVDVVSGRLALGFEGRFGL